MIQQKNLFKPIGFFQFVSYLLVWAKAHRLVFNDNDIRNKQFC